MCLGLPARSIVTLLVRTGMRIGELSALRWRNVDLENGVIRITEIVYEGHFDEPKTKRRNRSITAGSRCDRIARSDPTRSKYARVTCVCLIVGNPDLSSESDEQVG